MEQNISCSPYPFTARFFFFAAVSPCAINLLVGEKKKPHPTQKPNMYLYLLVKKSQEKPSIMEKGGGMEGVGDKHRTQNNTFSEDCSRQKGHVMLNSSQ